jgi:hypothetical protein
MLRTRLIAGATSGFVLSAVSATLMTFICFGETFFEPWRVDPARPSPITLRLPRTTLRTIDEQDRTLTSTAQLMVRRGEVANPDVAPAVRIYESVRRPPRPSQLGAHWVVYFLVVTMMTTYLRRGSARQGTLLRTQVGLLALALLFLTANKALLLFTALSGHLVPIALVPLWASFYLDRRTGLLMSGVMTVLSASLISYDPIVCATYFTTCAAGALYIVERKRSARLLFAGFPAALAGLGVYAAAREVFDGFSLQSELQGGLFAPGVAVLAAGIAAGVLAFLLRPLVSQLLGVLSRGQMMNLTDLDQPLLRKMATEAPGSWEHSRAMANLAEAAAASIHADALLTRTGAYYHDLGKTAQAKYYIENLSAGERSPHEDLEPEVSADAVMAHVIEGVRILREGGIPEPVVEFVYTHHGTTVVEYFWHKCLRQGNPKGLSPEAFRYPGMPPRTKETASLMLIDSIEAGARTVDPPTHEAFEQLVQRVVFSKMKQGQLDDAGLTIEDLRILANQIADTLVSVHHSRIRYPWQDAEGEAPSPEAPAAEERERSSDGEAAPDSDAPAARGELDQHGDDHQ